MLFCQSTSRAGAVRYKQWKEHQGTEHGNSDPKSFSSCHLSGSNRLKASSWPVTYYQLQGRERLSEGHKLFFLLPWVIRMLSAASICENLLG